jgi:hypothetical protein
VLRDHRVDLRRQPDASALLEHAQPIGERPFDASEVVVNLRRAAVEAHREPCESGILQRTQQFRCRERRGRGRGGHAEPEPGAVPHQLHHVRPRETIAAAQHEDDASEVAHARHHRLRFCGRQLARVAVRNRLGAAVSTGERAGTRRLPDHDEGLLREIQVGDARTHRGGVGRAAVREASRDRARMHEAGQARARPDGARPTIPRRARAAAPSVNG